MWKIKDFKTNNESVDVVLCTKKVKFFKKCDLNSLKGYSTFLPFKHFVSRSLLKPIRDVYPA